MNAVEIDGPSEVGHEDERALQHPHEQRRTAVVIGRDLFAELANAALQLLFRNDYSM